MYRITIILFTFFGFSTTILAQSKMQESYRSYRKKSETVSSNQLINDASSLKSSDPNQALDNVQEALGISIADGNDFNVARCYLLIGQINAQLSEWNLARDNYLKANQILSQDFPATTEYKTVLAGLGQSNLQLKRFQEALVYYQQAIDKVKANEQPLLQLEISEVYYQMGNYIEAKKILDGLGRRKIPNESFETLVQNQLAKINTRLNEASPKQDIYQNSLNTLRSGRSLEPQTTQSLQETKEEIAGVYRGQQRYEDEIDLRNDAIEFNLESKNYKEVARDKKEISITLEAKGESAAALKEMESAAMLADTLNDPTEKSKAFLALAELYERNGRSGQALVAYKKYSKAVSASERQMEQQFKGREELLKKQQDIEELTANVSLGKQQDSLQEAVVFRQQLIIYGLTGIIFIVAIASFFTYRSAQNSKTANQLLALKSLRSQMNPHFIFNALNSVNHFIAQQDERSANKFLSEFSQLMRLVLDNSQQDFITLNKELEMLSLYVKLEHYRFRDKFDFEFDVQEGINGEMVELPPMLIQPYIENAVWHGLRYKESKGKLSVRLTKRQNEIEVEIKDDGIGRKKSSELKTANQKLHNSTGLKNIHERLNIINKVYHANYRVAIEDLQGDSGTKVKINLPIKNQSEA